MKIKRDEQREREREDMDINKAEREIKREKGVIVSHPYLGSLE